MIAAVGVSCMLLLSCICVAFKPSYIRQRRLFAASRQSDGIGVGIDLGTTNSAVAFLDGDMPKIIEIPNNGRTMKSVVAFDESGNPLVGAEAIEWEQKAGISAYRNVKRVIGTGIHFLSKETVSIVPHVVASSDSAKGKRVKEKKPTLQRILKDATENPTRLNSLHKGKDGAFHSLAPENISAVILKHLLHIATEYTQKKITRAVIGVPAYFDDKQREATIRAANLAGIDKVKLLREPEAAALAYGINKASGDEEELVLVFDLGGGTYDVSVLLVEPGLTEIVCTAGNAQLGGSNFDAKIAKQIGKIVNNCCRREDGLTMMTRAAECIRIYLSNNRRIDVALPLTEEQWIQLGDPSIVIVDEGSVFEAGGRNATHAFVRWTRKEVEAFYLDELLDLLRPMREVAIMAGAMLPGDARPSVVESALEMDEAFREAGNFYEEDDIPTSEVQQKTSELDYKDAKKEQQKGRKKARLVAKEERKYRAESKKAGDEPAAVVDTKIRADGISGRPLRRVVLVGGATRMPAIGKIISALTGCVPQKTVDPDEAVALGCAVHVGVLDGTKELGTVLNPMQAAILRALAEKDRRDGKFNEMFTDDDDNEFGEYKDIKIL
jgi:molecular chaperone DnaK (HSP70)